MLYSTCPLYHARVASPCTATVSATANLCAADKKMTGKDVAYLIALYSGRLLSFVGNLYSTMHCLKRTAYGKL